MYYPSNRVIANRIARPGELTRLSGEEYVGKYWITYDGKYFEGEFPNPNPTLLYKTKNNNNFKKNTKVLKTQTNNKLLKINPLILLVDLKDPTYYYPNISDNDYRDGSITRYFAKQRKIRKFKILEIDKNQYTDIINQNGIYNYPMWDVTSILWKISGPLNSTFNGNIITKAGVLDTNQRLVELKNKEFIGIDKYLTNFQEFYK